MINGTIKNYAKRRGFEFDVHEMNGEVFVDLFEFGEDCEPMVCFKLDRHGLQLVGFCYNKHLNEDFPALISDVVKLKEALNYFKDNI